MKDTCAARGLGERGTMLEPPGATFEDYRDHIDRLVATRGAEWVAQNQRMIDRAWDRYRMVCWVRARPEEFTDEPGDAPIPEVEFHQVRPQDFPLNYAKVRGDGRT